MGWDEKNRDEWARKFLEETFKSIVYPLEGTENAKLSFFRVETSGDCSLAMKGGQPRPIFELKMELDWKVEQPIDKGKSMIEIKGQVQVTDFSSEDINAPQMKLVCDNQLPPGASPAFKDVLDKLNAAVKSKGLPEISRVLAQDFVEELKKQT
eukprot:TRINITY_DN13404_c1_g1_i1.p1 TRINITY_DN13404_c1_g1~~TRINITY_DN13404_c1_g1_i1.p1  ORF type:complete len:153 (-),score=35.93 TRINITY_DN13404_c1_g1_i1:400-858(-)